MGANSGESNLIVTICDEKFATPCFEDLGLRLSSDKSNATPIFKQIVGGIRI